MLGLSLYACKVLRDPLRVGAYDELFALADCRGYGADGHCVCAQYALGVSPYYPGIELAGTALLETAGIPIFEAGVLTLATWPGW